MEAEARFRAMGSDVHVVVVGGPLSLLDTARDVIEDLEGRWSRFRPTSEVSRMNVLAGVPVRVSLPTLALVQRALEGAWITGGRYDATVLGDVLRAGYDRSLQAIGEGERVVESTFVPGFEGIAVDLASSTVTLPEGVGFDPGGIGKGFAADLLVGELLSQGAAGACANVGGDLRVEGAPRQGESWLVAIEHPLRPRVTQVIGLRSGGVATSSRMRRMWGLKRDPPHLIDAATGRSALGGLASATVMAAEGWQAEVVAKAAFEAGVSDGLVVLASTGTEGLLVDDSGRAFPSAGFHGFAEERPTAMRTRQYAS
jgi:thiamine biosynthesis lipoprotein